MPNKVKKFEEKTNKRSPTFKDIEDVISIGALLRPVISKAVSQVKTTDLESLYELLMACEQELASSHTAFEERFKRTQEALKATYAFGASFRFVADKIEEIKKQMASGDSKGAMRELESLLNQLSILSKEMERTLDQWKSNLDQGAMQAQEKFMKKLQDLRKKQEELAQKILDYLDSSDLEKQKLSAAARKSILKFNRNEQRKNFKKAFDELCLKTQ
jgi:ABC-type transporter Mla subunit MlaD